MVNPQEQSETLFTIGEVLPDVELAEMTAAERTQFFVDTLDLFDKVAEIEDTIRKFNNPKWRSQLEDDKGKPGAYIWRRRLNEQHQEALDASKQAFFQGCTPEERATFGATEQEISDELEQRYATFERAYRGTTQARHKKREEARHQYRLTMQAGYERADNESVLTAAAAGNMAVRATLEPELATTKDKLIGLRDDLRAGFVPTTHVEKNQAFEILDYMDLKKHPKGITTRLMEIFRKQQRDGSEIGLVQNDLYEYGLQSVISVTYEWADHLRNAMLSHEELVKLKELLDSGINPHISTVEALDSEPDKLFDYNVLVRFANLKSLRDGKAFKFDPLRTKEDRTLVHPSKNKIIEDVHTNFGSLEQIQEFIDQVATELNVKDGRVLVDEAIADQASRRLFWYRALRAVADYKGTDRNDEGFQVQALQALKAVGSPLVA